MKIINVCYFRNCSSNAHQVNCEDIPTKGLYGHCQIDDLDVHSRSQVRLKPDYFLTCDNYIGQYLDYYIQTRQDGRLMDGHYAQALFDDFDLAARSQWVGKGHKAALHGLGD